MNDDPIPMRVIIGDMAKIHASWRKARRGAAVSVILMTIVGLDVVRRIAHPDIVGCFVMIAFGWACGTIEWRRLLQRVLVRSLWQEMSLPLLNRAISLADVRMSGDREAVQRITDAVEPLTRGYDRGLMEELLRTSAGAMTEASPRMRAALAVHVELLGHGLKKRGGR